MAATKRSGRKYGKKASDKVERAMHEMKRGKLKSGRSGRTVKSKKQAIAIGLSEARAEGGKVPPEPKKTAAKKKRASTGGKAAAKKTAKRSTAKKTAKKSTAKKSAAPRKSSGGSKRKSSKAKR